MKNLIVAFGYGAEKCTEHNQYVIGLITNDLDRKECQKVQIEHLENDDPESALKKINACISRLPEVDKKNIVVAYYGENLYLFKYRLPCESFDILKLREKISQAVSNDACHQKTELVDELFIGGILRFLLVD